MMDFNWTEGAEMLDNEMKGTDMNNNIPVLIPHCPVILVLDTSHSMWNVLSDLKEALCSFYNVIRLTQFENAKIDLAVISMGEKFGMLEEFTAFEHSQLSNLSIRPKGDTPMGCALMLALDKLEEQKAAYCRNHQHYATPQLIMLSDGIASDDISEARTRIQSAIHSKDLIFRTIALGTAPDMGILNSFGGDVIFNSCKSGLNDSFHEAGKRVSQTYETEVSPEICNALFNDPEQDPAQKELYILDGSNIIHWNDIMSGVKLQYVLAIVDEIKVRNSDYIVFFDASARHQMLSGDAAKYEQLIKNDPSHFRQTPAKTQADDFILHLADITPRSTIISRDIYKQYKNKYPWLNGYTDRVVSGMVLGNEIFISKLSWSIPVK